MTSTDEQGLGVAHCAVHPDVQAVLTCPICGSYACPECAIATPARDSLCAECVAAGRAASPMDRDEGRSAIGAATPPVLHRGVDVKLSAMPPADPRLLSDTQIGEPRYMIAAVVLVFGLLFALGLVGALLLHPT